MKTERETGASVLLKNSSDNEYAVAELGDIIVIPDATIDLMDEALPVFYDNYNAASGLVTVANQSQLWTDIQEGTIEVVELVPPKQDITEVPR